MLPQILAIETASFRALPALTTHNYDGWVLRMADGLTRRANSVNPVYSSSLPLDDKIAYCERLFEAQQLPVVFRLTRHAQPMNLDAVLDASGYTRSESVLVQTFDLRRPPVGNDVAKINSNRQLTDAWLEAYLHLEPQRTPHRETLVRILQAIHPQAYFVHMRQEGAIVAVGMAVVDSGWLGLFDIAVDPSMRRRGIGTRLVQHLLRWGQTMQAHTAYLQVHGQNTAAQHLYYKLGFRTLYRYWYRTKPTAND